MSWSGLGICCALAYLIGAIPFSWLFVRVLKGVDLRTVGSGNLGSTNAMRVLGVRWGLVIQVLDILKGWVPVYAAGYFKIEAMEVLWTGEENINYVLNAPLLFEHATLLIGLCAVLGHMFPIYMKFRGGKGVNTSLGVFLALAPKAALFALAVGLAVLALTRYVSLCSITGAILFPIAVYFFYRAQTALLVVAVATAVLIVCLHRSNIRRLLAGTESRLGKKTATEEWGEQKPGSTQS